MVKIYSYENDESDFFYMEAEVESEAAALLFQKIFRDAINVNRSVESTFGIGENFEDYMEFDYPLNTKFMLLYSVGEEGSKVQMTVMK